jgi:signal transduction histidine kinase
VKNHPLDVEDSHSRRSAWVSFKKTSLLMVPRSRSVDYVLRIGVALVLVYQTQALLTAVTWLLVSIAIDVLIAKQMQLYRSQVADDVTSESARKSIYRRFRYLWYVNTLWFGITSFVFAGDHTVESQMVMICFLNLIALLCVAKTSAHTGLCYRIIFIIIFSQVAGVAWNIASVFDSVGPIKHYIYIIYLLFQYLVLLRISRVFFKYVKRNFELQFDNNELINNLSAKSTLLDHERKIAISANETIQRFYSNAAHDVRQPVYAMQMYASMLHEDASLGDILLPKIQQSCIGINSLFNSLFDFQQLKLGTIDYQPSHVRIHQLLQELSIQFMPLAQKKHLKIKFKPVDGDVFVDEILIKRVLGNLIVNAIRYTTKGGLLVAVRHEKSKKMLNFEIWDTGQGIADENKLLIFNEFFKVPDQKVQADEGFGLGLSIVRQLSQLVAGSHISVKSKLHRGSVFKFSVPDALYSATWKSMKSERASKMDS